MRPPPIARTALRTALASHDAAPRKRLGQHFLVDDNLLAAIVRDSEAGPGEHVLEVGPGPGLLTRHLLGTGAFVHAVELDPAMESVASELIEAPLRKRLSWTRSDAMAGPRHLSPAADALVPQCARLVSNLPYGIAAPLLACVAAHPHAPRSQTVMVQREVGDRIAAGPGGRDYGSLSVVMQLNVQVRVVRRVPPGAFWPRPAVDSVVLALQRRDDRPDSEDSARLQAFLAAAFHNRRKTLANSVSEATGRSSSEILSRLKIPKIRQKLRAEAYDALELIDLARIWATGPMGERFRPTGDDRSTDRDRSPP